VSKCVRPDLRANRSVLYDSDCFWSSQNPKEGAKAQVPSPSSLLFIVLNNYILVEHLLVVENEETFEMLAFQGKR